MRITAVQYDPRPRVPTRVGYFEEKGPELLEINANAMCTIPTVSNLVTKPSDVFTFTTGRSLGIPARVGVVGDDIRRLHRAT